MEIKPAEQQILGLTERYYQKASGKTESVGENKSVVLNKSFDGYISRALSVSNEESVDIEQIRKEMNSGQYDSPETIRQAAQNILSNGI